MTNDNQIMLERTELFNWIDKFKKKYPESSLFIPKKGEFWNYSLQQISNYLWFVKFEYSFHDKEAEMLRTKPYLIK